MRDPGAGSADRALEDRAIREREGRAVAGYDGPNRNYTEQQLLDQTERVQRAAAEVAMEREAHDREQQQAREDRVQIQRLTGLTEREIEHRQEVQAGREDLSREAAAWAKRDRELLQSVGMDEREAKATAERARAAAEREGPHINQHDRDYDRSDDDGLSL